MTAQLPSLEDMETAAKYEAYGITDENVCLSMGWDEEFLHALRQTEIYQQIRSKQHGQIARQDVETESSWDTLEAKALQGLNESMAYIGDPQTLLQIANAANRAQRRLRSKDVLQASPGTRVTLQLSQRTIRRFNGVTGVPEQVHHVPNQALAPPEAHPSSYNGTNGTPTNATTATTAGAPYFDESKGPAEVVEVREQTARVTMTNLPSGITPGGMLGKLMRAERPQLADLQSLLDSKPTLDGGAGEGKKITSLNDRLFEMRPAVMEPLDAIDDED